MSHTVHTFEGTISGMTCGHCVASVTEEIQEIQEIHVVTAVDVTLETGAVSITSDQPLDTETVRRAVDEAGYQLV